MPSHNRRHNSDSEWLVTIKFSCPLDTGRDTKVLPYPAKSFFKLDEWSEVLRFHKVPSHFHDPDYYCIQTYRSKVHAGLKETIETLSENRKQLSVRLIEKPGTNPPPYPPGPPTLIPITQEGEHSRKPMETLSCNRPPVIVAKGQLINPPPPNNNPEIRVPSGPCAYKVKFGNEECHVYNVPHPKKMFQQSYTKLVDKENQYNEDEGEGQTSEINDPKKHASKMPPPPPMIPIIDLCENGPAVARVEPARRSNKNTNFAAMQQKRKQWEEEGKLGKRRFGISAPPLPKVPKWDEVSSFEELSQLDSEELKQKAVDIKFNSVLRQKCVPAKDFLDAEHEWADLHFLIKRKLVVMCPKVYAILDWCLRETRKVVDKACDNDLGSDGEEQSS